MDELSLKSFLIKCNSLSKLVFPRENARITTAKEVIDSMYFEEREANQASADFFIQYINETDKSP